MWSLPWWCCWPFWCLFMCCQNTRHHCRISALSMKQTCRGRTVHQPTAGKSLEPTSMDENREEFPRWRQRPARCSFIKRSKNSNINQHSTGMAQPESRSFASWLLGGSRFTEMLVGKVKVAGRHVHIDCVSACPTYFIASDSAHKRKGRFMKHIWSRKNYMGLWLEASAMEVSSQSGGAGASWKLAEAERCGRSTSCDLWRSHWTASCRGFRWIPAGNWLNWHCGVFSSYIQSIYILFTCMYVYIYIVCFILRVLLYRGVLRFKK